MFVQCAKDCSNVLSMTAEKDTYYALGAEFTPNLKELRTVLGDHALTLLAKLQWNSSDRKLVSEGNLQQNHFCRRNL